MAIARGGEDTARGAVHKTETAAPGTEIAQALATDKGLASESVTSAGTDQEVVSTNVETYAVSHGENESQTRSDPDHVRARENAVLGVIHGAGHPIMPSEDVTRGTALFGLRR